MVMCDDHVITSNDIVIITTSVHHHNVVTITSPSPRRRSRRAPTGLGLGVGKTLVGTLKKLEDFLHDDVLDIDLVLVVQVGSGELNLV